MMDKIRNSIILGALFHDLEKVLGKGYFENNPEFFGALENVCDVEELKNILSREKDSGCFQIVSLASGFQSGKSVGEEFEKSAEISDEKKRLANLFPFISIKEDVEKNKKKLSSIPFNDLSYSNFENAKLFIGDGKEPSEGEYKKEFKEKFEALLESIKNSGHFFDAVFSFFAIILQKYAWCLPANTEDEIADISLWEHLSLTAAIADCFYLYLKNNNESFNLAEISLEKIEEAKEKEAFRLIIGDFSGIQGYIFNIQKMKTAGKRLKGRSFLVQMISEDIKNHIFESLKLNSLNTIISAGGKFIVLVPNLDNIETNFINIKREVEGKMFERFKGEIKYNLALSDAFSGWEFSEPKESAERSDEEEKREEEEGGNFGKYFDETFIKAAKSKYRPFENVLIKDSKWNVEEFIVKDKDKDGIKQTRSDSTLCKLCKKYLTDEKNYKETAKMVKEDSICGNCGEEIELGKMLRKENKYIIWKKRSDKPNDKEAKLLFSNIKLANDASEMENGGLITVINPDGKNMDEIIKSIAKNGKVEAKFFTSYVAMKNEKEVKEFGEILDDEMEIKKKGLRKLAVLKGDVDNLGKIFYFGLKNYKDLKDNSYTATRLKTLSLYMNLFFEGYINYLAKEEKYKNVYIVFSGGDDFTVVGHWETMINFALDLNEKFKSFVCQNDEVHFSASLHLMNEKWPIFEEIEKAEEELKEAKNKDEDKDKNKNKDKDKDKNKDKAENEKNKIWIFGKAIFWDEFIEIKKLADVFQKHIDSDEVKIGYLWKLHKISEMIYNLLDESEEKPLKEKAHLAMWRPYLYYYTERNLEGKAKNWINEKMIKELEKNKNWKEINIIKNLDIFATYLLYKNRR